MLIIFTEILFCLVHFRYLLVHDAIPPAGGGNDDRRRILIFLSFEKGAIFYSNTSILLRISDKKILLLISAF